MKCIAGLPGLHEPGCCGHQGERRYEERGEEGVKMRKEERRRF